MTGTPLDGGRISTLKFSTVKKLVVSSPEAARWRLMFFGELCFTVV